MSDLEGIPNHRKSKAAWDRVLLQAAKDQSFRDGLMANPRETLLSFGIEFPANMEITVHDYDPNHQYIFLPPFGGSIAKPGRTVLPPQGGSNLGGSNG